MGEGRYFHATLYIFGAAAVEAVISRFRLRLADASAICWYDAEQACFELVCPGGLGPHADSTLSKVIQEYIIEELTQSSAEARLPYIKRLKSSVCVDELNQDDLDLAKDSTPTTNTSQPVVDADEGIKTIPNRFTRFAIDLEQKSRTTFMKLSKISQLPEGSGERILGSEADRKYCKAMSSGLTLRATKIDGDGDVFNGGIGAPLSILDKVSELAILDMASFPPLSLLQEQETDQSTTELAQWRFVGKQPTVSQWLAGMGEVEAVSMDEKRPMPRETQTLLIADHEHQDLALGRVRVPKGYELADQSDQETNPDSDDSSVEVALPKQDFRSLLTGKGRIAAPGSDTSDGESQSGNDSSDEAGGAAFSKLLKPSSSVRQVHTNPKGWPLEPDEDRNHLRKSEGSLQQHAKSLRSPRPLPTPGSLRPELQTSEEPAKVPKLIDEAIIEDDRLLAAPPGYGMRTSGPLSLEQRSGNTNAPVSVASQVLRPEADARRHPSLPHSLGCRQTLNDFDEELRDVILENLGKDAFAVLKKHKTMRQQAKRGSKTTSTKGTPHPHVELPKPEPPAAPKKARKLQQPVKAGQPKPTEVVDEPGCTVNERVRRASNDLDRQVTPPGNGPSGCVEALLHLAQSTSKCRFRVEIGLAMVKPTKAKSLQRTAADMDETVRRLHVLDEALLETFFLQRLTTSTSDAYHVINLASGDGELVVRAAYTFDIRDQQGNLHQVRSPADDINDFEIVRNEIVTQSIMFFPMRVWDARASVVDNIEASISREAIQTFLSTARTVGRAPSISVKLTHSTFTLERVVANREYVWHLDIGRVVVTQCSDLVLESISSAHANMKAVCHPETDMISQQRLWWECRVEVDSTSESADAARIVALVNHLVTHMDGVGFYNRGPWVQKPKEADAEGETVSSEVPFW